MERMQVTSVQHCFHRAHLVYGERECVCVLMCSHVEHRIREKQHQALWFGVPDSDTQTTELWQSPPASCPLVCS